MAKPGVSGKVTPDSPKPELWASGEINRNGTAASPCEKRKLAVSSTVKIEFFIFVLFK